VDFWAPWCGPCKAIGPILEKLETAYGGGFKLAKINSDEEQQLAGAFGIKSIPTVVLLKNGQPVDGFMGALPEGKVREFLDKHVTALEAEPEEDASAVAEEPLDAAGQLERLQHAVATDPSNDNARFDYVKALLQAGRTADARRAFEPVAAKGAADRRIYALQQWLRALDAADGPGADPAAVEARIAANRRDFDARYAKAQGLLARQQWTAAMDELLEILMRDKAWNDDLARKTYIAILDLIEPPRVKVAEGQIPPDDPVVASYRRRLSSVVLS
jgi:putative thioredoxin